MGPRAGLQLTKVCLMSAYFFYVNMTVRQDEDSSVKSVFLKQFFISFPILNYRKYKYISEFLRVDLRGKMLKKKG